MWTFYEKKMVEIHLRTLFRKKLFIFFLKVNAIRKVGERIIAVVVTDQEAVPPPSDIVEIDQKTAHSTKRAETRLDVILGDLALTHLAVGRLFEERGLRTGLVVLPNEKLRSKHHLAKDLLYLQLQRQKR